MDNLDIVEIKNPPDFYCKIQEDKLIKLFKTVQISSLHHRQLLIIDQS